VKPADFETFVKGLSSNEIISAAVECGFLENSDICIGDEVAVPRWLAEILIKLGIAEATYNNF
jgi:hypothetical protein